MSTAYNNIRIFVGGSLNFLPNGEFIGDDSWESEDVADNPLPITLVSLGEIGSPDFLDKVTKDFQSYPDRMRARLISTAKETRALGHIKEKDLPTTLYRYASDILCLGGDEASRLWPEYIRIAQSKGIEQALEIFVDCARARANKYNPNEIVNSLSGSNLREHEDIPGLEAQKEKYQKLLYSLPYELTAAVNRIGAKVIFMDEGGSYSDFSTGIIRIGINRLDPDAPPSPGLTQEALLRDSLQEEFVHYLDSFLGFTERPDWHAKTDKMSDLMKQGPSDKQLLRYQVNLTVFKEGLSQYRGRNPGHYAVEILPDTVRAMGSFLQSVNPKISDALLRDLYGDLMPDAQRFLDEISLVARGIHPLQLHQRQPERREKGA